MVNQFRRYVPTAPPLALLVLAPTNVPPANQTSSFKMVSVSHNAQLDTTLMPTRTVWLVTLLVVSALEPQSHNVNHVMMVTSSMETALVSQDV